MKKLALVSLSLVLSPLAFANGDSPSANIVDQLMGAVDTSTLIATVTSLGVVAVSIKFGEKGITFVKRLIGKV